MRGTILRLSLSLAGAVFFFGGMASLGAAPFNPTTSAQFQTDLNMAAANGQDDVITLPADTFFTDDNGGDRFLYTSTENKSLTIQGAGAGLTFLDTTVSTTLLDIDVGGAAEDADVKISGITFQNGEDDGLVVNVSNQNLQVAECDFIGNNLGLIFLSGGGSASVSGSNFNGNETGSLVSFAGVAGTVSYSDNLFQGNQHALSTTAGSEINVVGNRFINNVTIGSGSALLSSGPSQTVVKLTNNLFLRNSSNGPGGATFFPGPSLEIVGNVFSQNKSLFSNGGAVNATSGSLFTFTQNTVVGNSAATDGDGLYVAAGPISTTFFNNILFGNFTGVPGNGEDIFLLDDQGNVGQPVTLSHNDIGKFVSACRENPSCSPHITETANISEDPVLANAASDDFHLLTGSPCIATGDAAALLLPNTDLEGNPVNDPPDMGALAAIVTQITVDRSSIDFGDIALGVPNTQALKITNNGAAVLNVTGIALSDTANFAVEPGDCGGLAFSLASAESCTAQVTFKPGAESPFSATLTLSSNDPDEGSLAVGLSGTGVETGGGGGGGGNGGGGCALSGSSGKGFYAHFFLISLGLLGLCLRRRQALKLRSLNKSLHG